MCLRFENVYVDYYVCSNQHEPCARFTEPNRPELAMSTADRRRWIPFGVALKSLIGTRKSSSGNHELKVNGERFVSVLMSRLDTNVSIDEMSVYVKSVYNLDAKCVKLKTKHDSYTSFKIGILCNNASMF